MRTRLAIACGLMVFAMPALAQTSTTMCSPLGNSINCTTTTQPVYAPPPPIQQVDVAGAIRMAAQNRTSQERSVEQPTYFGEDPAVEFLRFRENNPWYDLGGLAGATQEEKRARALADLTADKFSAQGLQKEMPPSEFFARVSAEVKRKVPGLPE